MASPLVRIVLLALLSSSIIAEISSVHSPPTPEQAPTTNFSWTPRFVLIGNRVNFTAIVAGGTPPYTYGWDFGDGQNGAGIWTIHSFTNPGTYFVTLNATDQGGTGLSTTRTYPIVVNNWPAQQYGWAVRWNTTNTDGLNIWNVTFQGNVVIRDARFVATLVRYQQRFCGPFYDEPYNIQLQIDQGNIAYGTSTSPTNTWFQIIYDWYVGGYNYRQAWRFYPSGRWDAELLIGPGGCAIEHIYQPRLRVDLALGNENQDYMSAYTPQGSWQTLIWEGDNVDNGARDEAFNGTQWRLGDGGKFYYIVPTITRSETDLPTLPSKIILVRARAAEIEFSHIPTIEDPSRFVNGELAYRRNIALWFVANIWDRGPGINPASFNTVTLSFYPRGF